MAHAPATAGLARAMKVWAGVGPSVTARSAAWGLGRCSSGPKQMLWSSDVNLDVRKFTRGDRGRTLLG